MKTSPKAPLNATEMTTCLRQELPNPPAAGPDSWIYGGPGRPKEAKTDILAQAAMDAFAPGGAQKMTPLYAGWAGLASYKVELADKTVHLKMAMGDPKTDARAYAATCADAAAEGARASWAAQRGLGAQVYQVNPKLGAIVSEFVPGSTPSLGESQALLPKLTSALAQLHSQDVASLPSQGGQNWLLVHQNVGACLESSQVTRPTALKHGLLQLEAGLNHYLERAPFVPKPIHDDFHPANTLWDGSKLTVLDWANLHAGDVATDLGHLATMIDIPMDTLQSKIVLPYANAMVNLGGTEAVEAGTLTRSKAYTTLFRLRTQTFFDQWPGTQPNAERLRRNLADDVLALKDDVWAQMGFRPATSVTAFAP